MKYVMKRNGGRPCCYENTKNGLEAFKRDVACCISSAHEYDTLSAVAAAIGVHRMTIYNYKRRGREWNDCITAAAEHIKAERRQRPQKGVCT